MTARKAYDEPTTVTATDGEVTLDGPDGVAVSMTPEAAATTGRRLSDAADARGGRIDALLPAGKPPVTLGFRADKLEVTNTCNAMSGRYALKGHTIGLDPLASTRKACSDPQLGALDREVAQRLSGTLMVRMSKAEPLRLELTTGAGDTLVFAATPAAGKKP